MALELSFSLPLASTTLEWQVLLLTSAQCQCATACDKVHDRYIQAFFLFPKSHLLLNEQADEMLFKVSLLESVTDSLTRVCVFGDYRMKPRHVEVHRFGLHACAMS